MDNDTELDSVGKLAEHAESLLREAKAKLVSIESESLKTAVEIESSLKSTLQALASAKRLDIRDQTCAAKALDAVDNLKRAEKKLQDLQIAFDALPDFSWIADDEVTGSIDRAIDIVGKMRGLSVYDTGCSELASKAMEHLGDSLKRIQSVETDNENVHFATSTIAKTLAALYPVSRIRENPPKLPAEPKKAEARPPGAERRAAPRMEIEAEIGFQSESNFFTGFSEDISTGGLFIATYDTKEIGEKLSVNFTLPNGHIISVDGVVRWVREFNETTPDTLPGMGVQFENLKDEDKKAIDDFVAQRQPLFYEA